MALDRSVIRRVGATEADLQLVAPLFDAYRQFYGQAPDLALARRFLFDRLKRDESVVFAAFEHSGLCERALGFVQLYPSFSSVAAQRIWVLNDLFVIPSARRGGVGRRLMEQARAHALETGATRLVLETAAENRAAKSLYEALGYTCLNEASRFYALDLQ